VVASPVFWIGNNLLHFVAQRFSAGDFDWQTPGLWRVSCREVVFKISPTCALLGIGE
jgi:hypothetical protein